MSIKNIKLSKSTNFLSRSIALPASKSISNRALILQALANGKKEISNLSEARDTQTMIRLLQSNSKELDVLDAGTTMRFLTAFLSVTGQNKILTGTERMQMRPIKILVDALRTLGARIDYVGQDGFPPLKIAGFNDNEVSELHIRGDVSSQYISAIMMIAPLLQKGLKIILDGKIGSRPYIEMTLSVMNSFGVTSSFKENIIDIAHQEYKDHFYEVEPDWSAASYWYSLVALSKDSSVILKGLKPHSIQGDSVISEIMNSLGVNTQFTEQGAELSKKSCNHTFRYNFTHCPDLAQTIAVVCAAKGITAEFTGLESLKIKETDRVLALQEQLKKIGSDLQEKNGVWKLIPATKLKWDFLRIKTYDDHRMAMAFAPLCMLGAIEVDDYSVVNKSYPSFWDDFKKVGLIPS